ncbi:MAG: ComEC/Rec2 family competence protein [Candidatus Komeilibacteria bacterium]|nr:ComEC/Rec2 family competence protein [Candidatus Komeilibacteria bacterium]
MVTRPTTRNFLFCLFFILGVVTLSLGWLVSWAMILGGLVFIATLVWVGRKSAMDLTKLTPALFGCFVLGSLWLILFLKPILVNRFVFGTYVSYQGIVQQAIHEPEAQRLWVKTNQGLIQVTTKVFPFFWPQDQLAWHCQAKPALWRQTLRHRLQASCWADNVSFISSSWSISRFFSQQKDYLNGVLSRYLPHPASDLAAGLLWGERTALPAELTSAFQRVGLTHIVAVSGYNFTIVLLALGQGLLALGFNKKKSWLIQLLFIVSFILFTGASASVLRAGLMAALVVASSTLGRRLSFISLLGYMIVVLALLNPSLLVFDIGFQLSLGATLGLVYLAKPLEKILFFIPAVIKETLATTLAAILSTSPIILCYFGNFSLIALVSNLLVLPLIAWNMSWALMTLILGWLPIVGWLISWLTAASFSGMIEIIVRLAAWQYANLNLQPGPIWLVGYLLIIPLGFYLQRYGKKIS